MTKVKWNYVGDINLERGGFYWREDGSDDYVVCVNVVPCSDAGGPDNLFVVEEGSIYLPSEPDKRKSALDWIGSDPKTATRAELVYACKAWAGIERDFDCVVRIGPEQKLSREGWNPKPDVKLRSNVSLARYVKREFLS